MRFDHALKKIVATNVQMFMHFMRHHASEAVRVQGEKEKLAHQFIASMCKVGYQNNLFLAQNLANMEFLPGDENTAEMEDNFVGDEIAEMPTNLQQTEADKEAKYINDPGMRELLKIVNTPDYPVLEWDKEKDGRKDEGSSDGGTIPQGSDADTGRKVTLDWYKKLFKPGTEIPPRKDSQGTDGPQIGPSQEGE